MTPTLTMADVEQMQRSIDREIRVRERARRIELVPERQEEARRLFRLADVLRRGRVELMERCGIR